MDEKLSYIKSLGMNDETIAKILRYDSLDNNDIDLDDRLKKIYELLGFAKLTSKEIEKIIYNNLSILDFSNSELCKLAAVLENVNFNNDIIEKKTFSKGLVNYKRIFIRNLVLEASGKKNVYGNTVLTEPDYSAYGTKHNLSLVCLQSLKQSCDSDEELEEALDGKLIIGDKHYLVDDYIKILASLFYNKYLNSKKNMGAHK
jgi:hypothetical protein